ncbi:membrane protein [Actinomycetota bacterium]|nr:membrane protein [Actinomycetota bacterium]
MMLALLIILDILLIVCFAFIPYVTRKTELFGVSIPSEKTSEPELMKLRASYRNQLLAGGVVLIAVSVALQFLGNWESFGTVIIWLVVVFLYLAAAFLLYLPKHRQMKSIKHAQAWDTPVTPAVIVADTTPATKDVVSPLWLLLLPLITALTVLGIVAIWPQVPQQVPMHFDLAGSVDSYAAKGLDAVLPLLLTQIFLAMTIALCFFVVRHSKRQIDASNPKTSTKQSIRFRRANSIFLLAIGIATQLMIAFMQIMTLLGIQNFWAVMTPVIILMVVILVGMYIMMFRIGQGGSRIKESETRASNNVNVDDDRYWKLGQFYFNPNDPALFVEKRFGVGFTSNFARPLTWVLITGFIVLAIALLAVTLWLIK